MKLAGLFLLLAVVALSGCNKRETRVKKIVVSDSNLGVDDIIADTISYSVAIVAHDTTDLWMAERLKHVKANELVEDIFEKVYSGQIDAFDYFTGKKLTIKDVREIESRPDYSRDRIEEIVFEETWLFSAEQLIFHKEVHSMVLGYGVYADDGHRRGLKPVFRVKLN